jgi:hypothetical protein
MDILSISALIISIVNSIGLLHIHRCKILGCVDIEFKDDKEKKEEKEEKEEKEYNKNNIKQTTV